MEQLDISWGQVIAQLADHEDLTAAQARWSIDRKSVV